MSGSLEHLGGDRWRVRIYAGTDARGRSRTRSKSFRAPGERAARREMSRIETELRDESPDLATATVAEVANEWRRLRAPKWADATRTSNGQKLDRIITDLGGLPIRDLTPHRIDDWYDALGAENLNAGKTIPNPDAQSARRRLPAPARYRTPAAVHHYHRVLRAVLRKAHAWGYIDRVPTAGATAPKVTRYQHKLPTADQLAAAIGQATPDLRTCIVLGVGVGMREGEVMALRRSDAGGPTLAIDKAMTASGAIKAPKSGLGRPVKLSPKVVAALVEQRQRVEAVIGAQHGTVPADGPLFPNLRRGIDGSVSRLPGWLSHAWAKLADDIGCPDVRFHDLRHYNITAMIDAGVPITKASERAGHAQVSTTLDIYSHATTSSDELAAGVADAILG